MRHRSPARFLAPLALIGAVLAVYLVSRSQLSDPASASPSTSVSTPGPGGSSTAKKQAAAKKKKKAKTYTVQPGDVLGNISEKTGVAVADLLDYNEIDAQSLRVGQKLKLTP